MGRRASSRGAVPWGQLLPKGKQNRVQISTLTLPNLPTRWSTPGQEFYKSDSLHMEVNTRSKEEQPTCLSSDPSNLSKDALARTFPSCHPPTFPLFSWLWEPAYLSRCGAQFRLPSSPLVSYPLAPSSLSDLLLFPLPPSQPCLPSPYSSFHSIQGHLRQEGLGNIPS